MPNPTGGGPGGGGIIAIGPAGTIMRGATQHPEQHARPPQPAGQHTTPRQHFEQPLLALTAFAQHLHALPSLQQSEQHLHALVVLQQSEQHLQSLPHLEQPLVSAQHSAAHPPDAQQAEPPWAAVQASEQPAVQGAQGESPIGGFMYPVAPMHGVEHPPAVHG
jgi:hypothetical protein